jgi:Phage integrase family
MAGVDLRTVQELGGWKTLAMVQRYAHLAPAHLHQAVERLVSPLQNFEKTSTAAAGIAEPAPARVD